jgi:hypothetical protein
MQAASSTDRDLFINAMRIAPARPLPRHWLVCEISRAWIAAVADRSERHAHRTSRYVLNVSFLCVCRAARCRRSPCFELFRLVGLILRLLVGLLVQALVLGMEAARWRRL